ncbi:MAG: hypothetical protein PHN54_01745 [Bacilli bacterium]|nr:hypothetical protein [Bacilli bacterium]
MKKHLKNIFLISLSLSFIFLYVEYMKYSYNKNEVINLRNEYYEISKEIDDINTKLSNSKLEKENISKEKEESLKLYKKWQDQNKILEDLLN